MCGQRIRHGRRINDQLINRGAISHNTQEIDEVRFRDIGDIEMRLGAGIFSDNFEDEFRRYKTWAI